MQTLYPVLVFLQHCTDPDGGGQFIMTHPVAQAMALTGSLPRGADCSGDGDIAPSLTGARGSATVSVAVTAAGLLLTAGSAGGFSHAAVKTRQKTNNAYLIERIFVSLVVYFHFTKKPPADKLACKAASITDSHSPTKPRTAIP